MRTAAICPTCATYTNAVCVIYDGPYLSNLDIAPLTDLEEIIGIIDAKIGTLQPALGFTPENVANKSTNVLLGTSNTLYPTQNAVKTYVDTEIAAIPVPTLQQVTASGSSTNIGILVANSGNVDTVEITPGNVKVYYDGSGEFIKIDKNTITFDNDGGFVKNLKQGTAGSPATHNLNLPEVSGNLAVSVNGNAANANGNITIPHPNKVYVAIISMVDGSIINLLKNTIGDTLTWTASSGVISTTSSVLASQNNTFVSVTSGSTVPKIISTDVSVSSINWNVSIYQTDNAGAPNSTDAVYVEIRIY